MKNKARYILPLGNPKTMDEILSDFWDCVIRGFSLILLSVLLGVFIVSITGCFETVQFAPLIELNDSPIDATIPASALP